MDESTELRGPRTLRAWISEHQILSFFILTYVISWTLWGLSALGGGPVLFVLGGFGPVISAVLVLLIARLPVIDWLRSLLVWRVPAWYYALALLFPVALYAVINLVLLILGFELTLPALPGIVTSYLGTFALVVTVGGGLEEPGWRGFALPRLQAGRSPVAATLILGLAWGVWHVPLYGPAGFIVPLILAFFYTWLYNRTGSVLLCILLHAAFTPAQDFLTFAPDAPMVDVVILGVYLLGALALLVVTRGRLGLNRQTPLAEATTASS